MRKNTVQSTILVPATPVTRQVIGLSSTQWAANFLSRTTAGVLKCYQSCDFVLEESWNLLQQKIERQLDTLTKYLKFNEHKGFLISRVIAIYLHAKVDICRRYYQENFRPNMAFQVVFQPVADKRSNWDWTCLWPLSKQKIKFNMLIIIDISRRKPQTKMRISPTVCWFRKCFCRFRESATLSGPVFQVIVCGIRKRQKKSKKSFNGAESETDLILTCCGIRLKCTCKHSLAS